MKFSALTFILVILAISPILAAEDQEFTPLGYIELLDNFGNIYKISFYPNDNSLAGEIITEDLPMCGNGEFGGWYQLSSSGEVWFEFASGEGIENCCTYFAANGTFYLFDEYGFMDWLCDQNGDGEPDLTGTVELLIY